MNKALRKSGAYGLMLLWGFASWLFICPNLCAKTVSVAITPHACCADGISAVHVCCEQHSGKTATVVSPAVAADLQPVSVSLNFPVVYPVRIHSSEPSGILHVPIYLANASFRC